MAAAAKMNCYCCGETVAVNLNSASRAYYHCGHCGLSVVSKRSESSEALLKTNFLAQPAPPPASAPIASAPPASEQTKKAPVKPSAFKTLMDVSK
jgi:hypothetical protein